MGEVDRRRLSGGGGPASGGRRQLVDVSPGMGTEMDIASNPAAHRRRGRFWRLRRCCCAGHLCRRARAEGVCGAEPRRQAPADALFSRRNARSHCPAHRRRRRTTGIHPRRVAASPARADGARAGADDGLRDRRASGDGRACRRQAGAAVSAGARRDSRDSDRPSGGSRTGGDDAAYPRRPNAKRHGRRCRLCRRRRDCRTICRPAPALGRSPFLP